MRIQHFLALVVLSLATITGVRAAATTTTWTGADPSGYWSAPANWSPAGVPTNGTDLVFPGGLPPEDRVSTNDLTGGFFRSITFSGASRHTIHGNSMTLTNHTSVIVNSGTNEIACDWIFSAIPSPTAPYYAWPRIGFMGLSELTVSGNIGGGNLYVAGGRLVMRGQFPGGRMHAYGGTQAFHGDSPHALSVTNVGGTILVQGSRPNLSLTTVWEMESAACASLSASGAIGDVAGCGHITLDSTLSVQNLGHFGGWGGLDIRLHGTNGGEYGRLVASGDVNLSSGRLLPSAGFTPQPGQVFTIVDKTSPGAITQAPFGPEGTVTTLNGMPFRISYVGGDGNDLTLTALGFVPITIPSQPGVYGSSAAWGDYDNDGRLDFLLSGCCTGAGSQLWRNTVSGFSNVTDRVAPGLPGVYQGSVTWGDYDNDGWLDLLLTGSDITQLWRNTGSGFSNVTATVAPGLPGLFSGSVAWGDYDNDGRQDFLLAGYAGGFVTQLWRNTGSGFSNVTARVAPALQGASRGAWGDYDNDGRLDFLLTGYPGGSQLWRNTGSGFSNVTASVAPGLPGTVSGGAWGDYDNDGRLDFLLHGAGIIQLWRNTASGFSNVTASVAPDLRGVYESSVAWGDFDNDGRPDFLLTGTPNPEGSPSVRISQLWRNTGAGFSNVTASVAPGLPGSASPVAWGDYDNDGRLDFLLTGRGQLWRNNLPIASNAPPAAPTGLSFILSGATVSLSWNPSIDDLTPSVGLTYNLRIGATPGASDVLAPMALTNGLRLLPAFGNAQAGTNAVINLSPGRYYWSLQAVDSSFAGSLFAGEQQFTIAPRIFEPLMLDNGRFQFSFSNPGSAVFEVLGTTNVALPLAQWNVLGPPASLGGSVFRFTDSGAIGQAQRFYILRAQ